MKTFGPLYVGKLQYWHRKGLPVIEVGNTRETDMPFRAGHCLVFRVPFTKPGFYIGFLYKDIPNPEWLTDEDIDDVLAKALVARVDTEGVKRVREK